jgi:hypothetical protein
LIELAERWKREGDLLRTATECADELLGLLGETFVDETDFDRFWDAYPRKEAKPAARRAWSRLKPDRGTVERILADVADRKDLDPLWQTRRTIPHPGTYLNGERWNDDWRTGNDGADAGRGDRGLTPGQRVARANRR